MTIGLSTESRSDGTIGTRSGSDGHNKITYRRGGRAQSFLALKISMALVVITLVAV